MSGLVVDLFAGGGGASTGIEAALGRDVDVAVNHDPVALAVHRANHPRTRHIETDVHEVDPLDATGGRPVDLLWASPDCTHFSVAKGDVPRDHGIRSLAWVVVAWAKAVRPAVILIENVREFQGWGPLGADGRPDRARMGETFREWRAALTALGYAVDHQVLDASRYGAPTRRRRLFLVARCDGRSPAWPIPTHGPGLLPFRTAGECIDWTLPCPSIFERRRPLAEKTLWRIAQGIRRYVLEAAEPFVVQVLNSGTTGRGSYVWPPGEPLRTVTAVNGFGVCVPSLVEMNASNRPRSVAEPLGVVTTQTNRFNLVSASLARHFGGVVGSDLREPIHTVTARDHHSLAAVALATFRGTHPSQPGSAPVTAPLPVISAGGIHVAEVRAFLTAYYGCDRAGQSPRDPMRTLAAKDRLGLVTVHGEDYQIADIGMRMLEPEELLRAQFGRFAAGYDMTAAPTKTAKVRLIGNSVCPEAAEALVRANCGQAARVERVA